MSSAVPQILYSDDKSSVAQTVDNGASNTIDNVYLECSVTLDKIVYQIIKCKSSVGKVTMKMSVTLLQM